MTYINRVFNKSCEDMSEIPDGVVHTCITSPPYFGLRDYGTGAWDGGDPEHEHDTVLARGGRGGSGAPGKQTPGSFPYRFAKDECSCGARRVDEQIGLEDTPEEYIERMVGVFRELKRVLRFDGTAWLNIGDGYARAGGWSNNPGLDGLARGEGNRAKTNFTGNGNQKLAPGYKEKDLMGIPWMLAFALRADGWYLRDAIIWFKRNAMPSSVQDRCTSAYEFVFQLAKSKAYFADMDAVKEPLKEPEASGIPFGGKKMAGGDNPTYSGNEYNAASLQGANLRNVWDIPTDPYPGSHFAVMPRELVRRCILIGCPAEACANCGAPYERVVELVGGRTSGRQAERDAAKAKVGQANESHNYGSGLDPNDIAKRVTKGFEAACNCGAGAVPGVVLDPFMGSGTVADVAVGCGRAYVGYELNSEYIGLIQDRLGLFGIA